MSRWDRAPESSDYHGGFSRPAQSLLVPAQSFLVGLNNERQPNSVHYTSRSDIGYEHKFHEQPIQYESRQQTLARTFFDTPSRFETYEDQHGYEKSNHHTELIQTGHSSFSGNNYETGCSEREKLTFVPQISDSRSGNHYFQTTNSGRKYPYDDNYVETHSLNKKSKWDVPPTNSSRSFSDLGNSCPIDRPKVENLFDRPRQIQDDYISSLTLKNNISSSFGGGNSNYPDRFEPQVKEKPKNIKSYFDVPSSNETNYRPLPHSRLADHTSRREVDIDKRPFTQTKVYNPYKWYKSDASSTQNRPIGAYRNNEVSYNKHSQKRQFSQFSNTTKKQKKKRPTKEQRQGLGIYKVEKGPETFGDFSDEANIDQKNFLSGELLPFSSPGTIRSYSETEDINEVILYFSHNKRGGSKHGIWTVISNSWERYYPKLKIIVTEEVHEGIHRCSLSYKDQFLGQGEDTSKEVAKKKAAFEMINKLAMTNFVIKEKEEYFGPDALKNLKKQKEKPGVFKMVRKNELKSIEKGFKYVERTFQTDVTTEVIFGVVCCVDGKTWGFSADYLQSIVALSGKRHFSHRLLSDSVVGVSYPFSLEYIKNNLLEGGALTDKYELVHPQGIGNNLLKDLSCADFFPQDQRKKRNFFIPQKRHTNAKVGKQVKRFKVQNILQQINVAVSKGSNEEKLNLLKELVPKLPGKIQKKVFKKLQAQGIPVQLNSF